MSQNSEKRQRHENVVLIVVEVVEDNDCEASHKTETQSEVIGYKERQKQQERCWVSQ